MKKKLLIIITGIILVGIVCIRLLPKNKSIEQMLVDRINEAVSHYTDINIKDDKTYSIKVSDTQMMVTTYMPEYTVFGVSTDKDNFIFPVVLMLVSLVFAVFSVYKAETGDLM